MTMEMSFYPPSQKTKNTISYRQTHTTNLSGKRSKTKETLNNGLNLRLKFSGKLRWEQQEVVDKFFKRGRARSVLYKLLVVGVKHLLVVRLYQVIILKHL
jgi:hypothetical protein